MTECDGTNGVRKLRARVDLKRFLLVLLMVLMTLLFFYQFAQGEVPPRDPYRPPQRDPYRPDKMVVYVHEGSRHYFHIGNVFSASEADLTSQSTALLSSNAGMYVGLNVSAMSHLSAASFEKDGGGNLTGRIFDAVIGTTDVLGRSIDDQTIDLTVLLSWDGGGSHHPPDHFGDSPDGLVQDTVWWLINGGAPGNYSLEWMMRLLPTGGQADGNYYFESEIVISPVL
jgi:hypothetical protein